MLRLSSIFLLIITVLVFCNVANAATNDQAVAALNQMRAQIGAPAVIANATLAQSCAQHANYMLQNKTVTHFENPLSPGYTVAGDVAGQKSVLAYTPSNLGGYTDNSHNPWYPGAPLHLFQMLHPALTQTGYADTGGYSCMHTLSTVDYARGAHQVLTFPANGQTGVPTSENTQYESPDPTVSYFNLPKGTVTGPYMFIYAHGFSKLDNRIGTQLSSIQMKDSKGNTVPIMKYDSADAGALSFTGSCLSYSYSFKMPVLGAYVVPRNPLLAGETYTVTATVKSVLDLSCFAHPLGSSETKTFSFTTVGTPSSTPGTSMTNPTTTPTTNPTTTLPACKVIVKSKKLSLNRRLGTFTPTVGCKLRGYRYPALEVKMMKSGRLVWVKQRYMRFVTKGVKKPVRVRATKAGKRVVIYSGRF